MNLVMNDLHDFDLVHLDDLTLACLYYAVCHRLIVLDNQSRVRSGEELEKIYLSFYALEELKECLDENFSYKRIVG